MPSQSDLRFTFTVGETEFEVIEFTLDEGLSESYQLALELASRDPAIDFSKILDAPAHFILWHGEQPVRHVHGQVSRFEQGTTGFRRTRYRALVEPPLARLELCADWRIFQQKTVPEILNLLLAEHGIAPYQQNLTEDHLTREYCVQAGDTDLDFLLRLAAEEGLFHRFDHRPDGCTLIHSDRLYIQDAIAGGPVPYNPTPGGDRPEPALRTFTYAEHVRTTRQTQRDYTFKYPQHDQQHSAVAERPRAAEQDYEHYAYPGRYKQGETGEAFTRDRLRGLRGDAQTATVEGDDPRLVPGLAFDLIGHPRQDWNHGWRPVHIRHEGRQHTSQAEESAGAESGTYYGYTAQLVPDRIEWRPAPRPRPLIPGPQVATVVGPESAAGGKSPCRASARRSSSTSSMATRTNPWSPGAATAWATARPTKAQAPGAQHPQERGEGFELRTDLHGALRAAQGMLLSTEAQANANGGLLDRAQLVSTLEAALELARTLGDYAGEHQGLAHQAKPQESLTEAVRAMGHGANDQADGGGNGSESVIALSAPAGIALASPRSIALGAGEHIDAAAREQVQLTAGEQMLLNAGQGLGTFAQSGDMRHIAHQGELLLQAQHNSARLEADQSVEISASNEHILVKAQEHITLLCGGAYLKMQGGNIELGMPGNFIVKAANHTHVGGAHASALFNEWSNAPFDDSYIVRDERTGKVLANTPVELLRSDGALLKLTTDAQGRLPKQKDLRMDAVELRLASAAPPSGNDMESTS